MMRRTQGFTLLEMVVVLVLMGIVTSLALPGLQKMYDSMAASLSRNELRSVLNNLALDVRADGHALSFSEYPAQSNRFPKEFIKRMEPLGVSLTLEQPLLITPSGFCPHPALIKVTKGAQQYSLTMRSPDCRVSSE